MHDPFDETALQALLDAERAAEDAPPEAVHDRLLGRVMASVAVPLAPFDPSSLAEPAAQITTQAVSASAVVTTTKVASVAGVKLWLMAGALTASVGVWVAQRPASEPVAPLEPTVMAPRGSGPVRSVVEPAVVEPVVVEPAVVEPAVVEPAAVEPVAPAVETSAEPAHSEPAPRAETPKVAQVTKPKRRAHKRRAAQRHPRAATPVKPQALTRDLALTAERALLGQGARALLRGDAQGALAAVIRHQRRFAEGRLVEEREVLRIRALVAADRRADARRVAVAFRARFSRSVFRSVVDAALAKPKNSQK